MNLNAFFRKAKNLIKKIIKKNQEKIRNVSFRTFQNLASLIRNNIHKLPEIDLIVGIPRSGIIPAYIIALFLNKQVCSLNEFLNNIELTQGDRNFIKNNKDKKTVLIVDDSISTGKALEKVKKTLEKIDLTKYEILYCAIYATNETQKMVDYYFEKIEQPRLFQWNYLNHERAMESCYDLDGVLCVDPTEEENDDGEKYIEFILNAKPLFIPNYEIHSIVTSRLEKYRIQTQAWLEKHNIKYKNLFMLDLSDARTRRELDCHADFKAKIFKDLKECRLFIESDDNQAKKIAQLSKKEVICVSTDEYYRG